MVTSDGRRKPVPMMSGRPRSKREADCEHPQLALGFPSISHLTFVKCVGSWDISLLSDPRLFSWRIASPSLVPLARNLYSIKCYNFQMSCIAYLSEKSQVELMSWQGQWDEVKSDSWTSVTFSGAEFLFTYAWISELMAMPGAVLFIWFHNLNSQSFSLIKAYNFIISGQYTC